MNLGKQKALASRALGVSKKRVKFNATTPDAKKQLKEVISREGVKDLVAEKVITVSSKKGNSRTRANHILSQKKKGRRSGHGNRKGTANARFKRKDAWMIKIRALRKYLKELKDSGTIDTKTYREMYRKCKGNFFRNKRHMHLFMEQNGMFTPKESKGGNKKWRI